MEFISQSQFEMATAKMTNLRDVTADLMVCMFTEEEMAASSVTGGGDDKKQLDPERTRAIIGE